MALAAAGPAGALAVRQAPIPERVALADCVVTGKVTAIEERTLQLSLLPGEEQKTPYRVAVIKIEEALIGARGETQLRVAFPAPAQDTPPTGGRPVLRRQPRLDLAVGTEGCFFLAQRPDETFYRATAFTDFVAKKGNNTFAKDLALARRSAKLLQDFLAGLQASDAGDRLLTANLLLARYRTTKLGSTGPFKNEPINARESRLLLQALADADWNKTGIEDPLPLFNRLGLTPQDGWLPPPDFKELKPAAKKWCAEHIATYRVLRLVPSKEERAQGGR
jgi:hypothetical protein